ncbi:MAG TPA: adenylate cyclase [Candidatus Paceibacterota bacterium]|nr:adenylate cyclase [Candidatus Paceibacterota bacterium]
MNDSVPMEHERRFVPDLAAVPMKFSKCPNSDIVQAYLRDGETRIRMETENGSRTYTKTVKRGEGISREEHEVSVTEAEFDLLWDDVEAQLSKRRYRIPWDGKTFELNIFDGPLTGYVQFEIEFPSEEEARSYKPPHWVGREVTDDKRHTNASLAKYGIPR